MNYEEKYKKSLDRAMNLFVTNNISATAVCEIFPELNKSEEINYEKKYKEALEWMQSLYDGLHGATKEDAEHYFPELQESEDEKIKREIVAYINELADLKNEKIPTKWLDWLEKQGEQKYLIAEIKDRKALLGAEKEKAVSSTDKLSFGARIAMLDELLAWVKKQGENKPTDKVEPKFKVGDWITDGRLTCKVLGVTGKSYELHLYNDDYCHFETDVKSVDKYYHLWTINDAKDGDVLVNWNNTTKVISFFIFKAMEDETVKFHIAYHEKLNTIKPPATKLSHQGLAEPEFEFNPATKEQHDLLFQKIKEEGYEWDADNKELKKIESNKLDANKVINWVNPDKVIEWLKNTIKKKAENYGVYKETRLILPYNSIEDLINDFKEDFGL